MFPQRTKPLFLAVCQTCREKGRSNNCLAYSFFTERFMGQVCMGISVTQFLHSLYPSVDRPLYTLHFCRLKKIVKDPGPLNSVLSTISKRKDKRFDIEAYYRNKTKTFWFGPLVIRTKLERFCLLQSDQKSKQNVGIFKKWQQNETKTFHIIPVFFKDQTKLLMSKK